jgi:hypothetical protein
MGRQHRPPAANRGTPYTDGATGLLDPVARNLIRFIEIAIRSRQNASNIPIHEMAPYGWIDGCLRRICNRGCRPGALPLLGLGSPSLIRWLQRREILHQEPVSEDVTAADLAQEDAPGRIIQKPDVVPRCIIVAP